MALALPAVTPLYVGVDISKTSHIAGFVSTSLLRTHRRFSACPVFRFANSRVGFDAFLAELRRYADLVEISVVMESTGHYHRALEAFLQEQAVAVYRVHPQTSAPATRQKSDKIDALRLANALYGQLALGVQSIDDKDEARKVAPPSTTAMRLRGLIRHHYELDRETSRRKNKLTAICDELFPELAEIFVDLNRTTALSMRLRFPTPAAVANAELSELLACRAGTRPGKAKLAELQELARHSIGVKDEPRVRGLIFEQKQLIAELRLLEAHMAELDAEIAEIIAQSREGQILTSLPGIGVTVAATLIAYIGSIDNFETAGRLRAFCGYSPRGLQTGVSRDSSTQTRGGSRVLRKMLYLATLSAIQQGCPWKALYERLLPVKCVYDARINDYRGKNKVVARVAGQMVGVIFRLLKDDFDLVKRLKDGEALPAPGLYDAERHRARRLRS